jgi:hypothetical protein
MVDQIADSRRMRRVKEKSGSFVSVSAALVLLAQSIWEIRIHRMQQ